MSINKYPKKKLIFLVALLFLIGNVVSISAQTTSPIHIFFLYSPDCKDCLSIFSRDVGAIASPYGQQVYMAAVDISLAVNQAYLTQLEKSFGKKIDKGPALVIGDSLLVGKDQIIAEMDLLIKSEFNKQGEIDAQKNKIDQLQGQINSQKTWITTLVIIGVVGLVAILALWFTLGTRVNYLSNQKKLLQQSINRLEKENKQLKEQNQPLEDNLRKVALDRTPLVDRTLASLIGLEGSPIDLLSEAQRILYYKARRSAEDTVKDANGFIITMLRTIASAVDLAPIAAYHQMVEFNPEFHICYTRVAQGEQVRVIETGWKKAGAILKKAVVEKA